jgi:lipopolysaccharide biosynthesis regulator YciM
MEFELWYLILIPVLFAAGWYARSFDIKEKQNKESETKTLYKGVDLLLSNKADQAVDSFIQLVKIDPDTVEMHHSLGAYFRRKGEFNRAIRIHTHLLNRQDLPKSEHARALLELGEDYLKAGIWDRAEISFESLSKLDSLYKGEAVEKLVYIFESEKEWLKAVNELKHLEQVRGISFANRCGHFYCELAELELKRANPEKADQYVAKALEEDPQNKRALILQGDLYGKKGEIAKAVEAWMKVGEIAPDYEPLLVKKISEALVSQGREDDAKSYIDRIAEKEQSFDDVDEAVQALCRLKEQDRAIELLQKRLEKKPSLLGFQRLLELSAARAPDGVQIQALANLLKQQVDKVARYQCSKCGFATRKFQWQCPGCRGWETFPPRRSENIMQKNA